jgi:methylated-DNA-[protein]-cysteine S-methyltransferase
MMGMRVWTPFLFDGDMRLALVAGERGIEQIRFDGIPPEDAVRHDDVPVLKQASQQLQAYFDGALRTFDLPLSPHGTAFQQSVWDALLAIPYGETRSYREVAAGIGTPKAVRAVGAANGQNPIPIVIPCHRVIGSNGKLTGFGGGLPLKRRLLDLESAQRIRSTVPPAEERDAS